MELENERNYLYYSIKEQKKKMRKKESMLAKAKWGVGNLQREYGKKYEKEYENWSDGCSSTSKEEL